MSAFPRKILVSAGFGAGWSTWNDPAQFLAEYAPFIEFVENGGDLNDVENDDLHPLRRQLAVDLIERGIEDGDAGIYYGGLGDCYVATVEGPYVINEYDGFESYETAGTKGWFT